MENSDKSPGTALARGAALIGNFARSLPETPGVYRMLDAAGGVLYVGKARALRRRVTSYTQTEKLPIRLQRMVAETADMVFVHTHTEVEALLLESNLIKKLKPRFNVLLRDDKSFPYILITRDHDFPLLTKHRGAHNRKGDYFGPFASVVSVNHTVAILQRAFMLRNCADTVFANRSRPCLQYHIKRCTAPCVGLVSQQDYAGQVRLAHDFLSGKSREVQDSFVQQMQQASAVQNYEEAAKFRDRIRALTLIQSSQDVNVEGLGDADVVGLWRENGRSCVMVFFFRGGQNFGNRAYFPRHNAEEPDEALLGAFLAQFYENKPAPREILLSHPVEEAALLEQALNEKNAGRFKVRLAVPEKGQKKRLVELVVRNAREALEREALQLAGTGKLLEGVAALFDLDETPQRIEVYDNSHIAGTNMVGAMIVAGPEGFRKNAYRKFNIREAAAADDYGMMREVMQRRFAKAMEEGRGPETEGWPDVLLIDGGQGQFNAVHAALEDMGIAGSLTLVSIAKGPDRNAGREKFFMAGRPMFQLPVDDPVLHYLQRLRDEAHRFAIGSHRARRSKQIAISPLDDVPGIGAKRKKALLLHFGSAQEVARAGVQDLRQVEGISDAVAEKIYHYFHDNL
ncbi:MAG: excinuclease ABC subunit UvrC [Micavibrio aeruginosavorus]|uniref:UvrABC system protein C n=1 Tax=Micavibrio aeruginosavorus TaxID=349221 RepID=A0A7T5UIV4_9BACT|nr:MAG: excinuclease ABC subunit UvrC [Micavibrio aeruginosavorus]